ncbi:MAG: SRP19 protein [Cenarchaeum symbiont of Oopsacas minuta]|nr:SRP19 protein [Cenarchaeum symbiont of Oopsacas minuta]
MKDYEHIIVWLDYFNKILSRNAGRRLARIFCVNDPSLKELSDAVKAVGFDIFELNENARYPRRPYIRSGYIAIPKKSKKTSMLVKIGKKMVERKRK